jgi:ABC-2 type transport system ATP-binding protein
MIKVKDVTYSIPNVGLILKDVNFEINRGDYIGLLGKNGAGKTTLIDLLMGFKRPQEGSVEVFNSDPAVSDRTKFSDVAFLSQDIWLKDNISVLDFFKFHSAFYETYSLEDQSVLLNKFKIDLKSKIGGLSTGQKRRVQITAALSSRPKILIIDEITAVLDPDARKTFFELLQDINSKHGVAIILATNIVEDLKDKAKSLLFIKNHLVKNCAVDGIEKLFNGDE